MKKILVVDDSEDIVSSLADLLGEFNYLVLTARNASEGITIVQEHHPDIILCDILMPGVDGYECLEMLKNNPQTREIPLIFLTARAEKAEIEKGISAGAVKYLTKPFDSKELLKIIEDILK